MFLINAFRLLNVMLALLSVIPAFLMLNILKAERPFVSKGSKVMNNILMLFYFAVVIGASYNAVLSFSLILEIAFNNPISQFVYNLRNTFVSASYLIISWGLYFLHKHEN